MRAIDIIRKKRQGEAHTEEEIRFLVRGYTQGAVPDYQMSAWLMAVVWRGLTDAETFVLTAAMVESGETLDLSTLPCPCVDKHSTGGVGDKTTLAVVPILAAAGVCVPKMSGRGLGHTGGTLDKLESLGGTRTAFTTGEILAQVRRIGACLCAQTKHLVPADRKMYALRDATDTVESLPLIAASIMSKKIAGGCPSIVLDVKVGGGAFMKNLPNARTLAELMIRIGEAQGRRVAAVLSDMDAPLGGTVGNLLEVGEVARLLQGSDGAEPRLKSVVLLLSAVGFLLAGRVQTLAAGKSLAEAQLVSGAALEKLCEIVQGQGGSSEYLLHPDQAPEAAVQWEIRTPVSGYVQSIDAEAIGLAAMRLGAGRAAQDDRIDPTAGIILHQMVGQFAAEGTVLANLCTNSEAAAREAAPAVLGAWTLGPKLTEPKPVIYETIGLESV